MAPMYSLGTGCIHTLSPYVFAITQKTSSDFNENQPKEGRKIFHFFNFVSWYQNYE